MLTNGILGKSGVDLALPALQSRRIRLFVSFDTFGKISEAS